MLTDTFQQEKSPSAIHEWGMDMSALPYRHTRLPFHLCRWVCSVPCVQDDPTLKAGTANAGHAGRRDGALDEGLAGDDGAAALYTRFKITATDISIFTVDGPHQWGLEEAPGAPEGAHAAAPLSPGALPGGVPGAASRGVPAAEPGVEGGGVATEDGRPRTPDSRDAPGAPTVAVGGQSSGGSSGGEAKQLRLPVLERCRVSAVLHQVQPQYCAGAHPRIQYCLYGLVSWPLRKTD